MGGKHGIGIVDIVENKCCRRDHRDETPGGTILYEAHQRQELILDRDTATVKRIWATSWLRSYTKENGLLHYVKPYKPSLNPPRSM